MESPWPSGSKNAHRFIQLVKLTKFKDAYPHELSGGMQQRVAIARTLANGPSILLMDEPFGALDSETKWQMQELMISIVEKSNATVLLVTHDIEEAIFLADRIVFMSRHPGTIRENLVTEFKDGRRFASHEEMIEAEGFYELAEEDYASHARRNARRSRRIRTQCTVHLEENDQCAAYAVAVTMASIITTHHDSPRRTHAHVA